MISSVTKGKIITGNFYDKYNSKNFIIKILMKGFYNSISQFILTTKAKEIHEVGCGEGHLTSFIQQITNSSVRGTDYSESVINEAKMNYPYINFEVKCIYSLKGVKDCAELIVCCEVLEHLEKPEIALEVLQQISNQYCILSVPREPIWRILNFLRCKYIDALGNTPGHLQHWSRRSFLKMISNYFEIVEVKTPLPWTMVLCKKKE